MRAIGIDLTWLAPEGENGGIKHYLVNLIDWIGREHDEEVSLVLLSTSRNHAELRGLARPKDSVICIRDDGIGIVPRDGTSFPSEVFDPSWPTRPQEIDVFYCPFAEVSAAPPDTPVLVLVHDLLHEVRPGDLPSAEVARRTAALEAAAKRSQLIQCLSDSMLNDVVLSLRIERSRAFATPLFLPRKPVKTPPLLPSLESHRHAYFLYPANAWPHKGHAMLLHAYSDAVRTRPDVWPLVFTGHPDERMRAVAQLASTLGISERCVFLGFVEEETLSAVMDAAGAMLFPSLYEGFGIPVYEALAASIPMAVSLIPVLRETAGDAPLWCRPGNIADWTQAILTLSGNEPERIRRIAAARARYELLKTGSCYDTLWNAFLRLVSTTPPKPAATVSCGAKTETPETFVGVLEAFIAATARSEAIPLSSINSMREIVAAEWRRIR